MNSIYICWWGVSCLLSKFVHSSLLPSVAPSPPVPPLLIFISCPALSPPLEDWQRWEYAGSPMDFLVFWVGILCRATSV